MTPKERAGVTRLEEEKTSGLTSTMASPSTLGQPPSRPGVSTNTLKRANIHFTNDPEPNSIEIPYYDVDGNPLEFSRVRLPKVRLGGQKYTQPPDSGARAYLAPWLAEMALVDDLVIVEGEFKALSLIDAGIPAVGLPGLEVSFRDDDDGGGRVLILLLGEAVSRLKPKRLLFLGDSDTALNFHFSRNAVILAELLPWIKVILPRIPIGGPGKGIDDCRQALGDDFEAFWRDIVQSAEVFDPKLGSAPLALRLLRREWPAVVHARSDEHKARLIKLGAALLRWPMAFDELAELMREFQPGLTKSAFRSACEQAQGQVAKAIDGKRRQSITVDDLMQDARPKIRLPGPDRLLSEFATELGQAIAEFEIYHRDGVIVTPSESGARLIPMTCQAFRTWAEQHVVLYSVRGSGEKTVTFRQTMRDDDARGTIASPQFLRELPSIEAVNSVQLPHLADDGELRMLPLGFDTRTGVLTAGEFSEVRMTSERARSCIDGLLSEFLFAPGDEARSKAVAVAGMLTMFGRHLLPRHALKPCFFYLANAEGAGKSLLAKLAIVPVIGSEAPTTDLPADESEMRKFLLASTVEAVSVILFDNIKGNVSSPSLEAFCTSPRFGGRILKESRTFSGTKDTVVFLTGNSCTVSPDMRRRSLFCDLFLEVERAEDRKIARPLDTSPILAIRMEILSALWQLVRDWHADDMPGPSQVNAGFAEWSNVIGGIVEHAGYGNPLLEAKIQNAGDTDLTDMRALCDALTSGNFTFKAVSFEELTDICRINGLFPRLIPTDGEMDRPEKSTFSKILQRYDRRIVGSRRFSIVGKGHGRRYQVQRL